MSINFIKCAHTKLRDYALYNASLATATNGTFTAASADYPTILYIGPSYFQSYETWPGVKFIHGFNLAKNTTEDHQLLLDYVPLLCTTLEKTGGFYHWELGNEPDLYKTSAQGIVRPPTWNESDYVAEWLNLTRTIHTAIGQACPSLYPPNEYTYYAPSFAGTSNSLNPIVTWHAGLDTDHDIAYISSHNYINGATVPGVTLQGTLMNHSNTVASISHQLNESSLLANYDIPFILGETNSLYNEGRPGLSNSFGAALWGVDFNLWCATNNIMRVHMHQGTNYRYASWQPIETSITAIGTKAPYYGNIAVANFIGDSASTKTQIANLPLPNEEESAYAAYVNGMLDKVMVVNMQEYNYSLNTNESWTDPAGTTRPVATYSFQGPSGCCGNAVVQRLMANGSDAITGITWNGVSYNYELEGGKPVQLKNVTSNEVIQIGEDGSFSVDVPWSSAAMVKLQCK